ncbi:MAG: AI-2E family transporter [Planctomycetaceae bacterium]
MINRFRKLGALLAKATRGFQTAAGQTEASPQTTVPPMTTQQQTTPTQRYTVSRVLIILASLVIIVAGLRLASDIVIPMLLSLFLTVICASPINWLRRHGCPRMVAICMALIVLMICGLYLVMMMGRSMQDFLINLPIYESRLNDEHVRLTRWVQQLPGSQFDKITVDYLNPKAGVQLLRSVLGSMSSLFSNAFLILLTVVFMLYEATDLPRKLSLMSGRGSSTIASLNRIAHDVRRYMGIKTLTSLLTGILVGGWLSWLRVDYPFLWGVVAFLFNFVPNIGSFLAAAPPTLQAYVQLGPDPTLYTLLGFLVINLVIGNVLEPRIMGRGLGLSTLVVFLSLVFWGWVLGPVGMLLSIPLTMAAKITLEQDPASRWIAVLLSSSDNLPSESPSATAGVRGAPNSDTAGRPSS